MIIRKFDLKDTDDVFCLIKEFYEESLKEYGITLNEISMKETLKSYADKLIGIVAELDEKIIGCIGGVVSKSVFDLNQIIGQESMWFIDKRFRGSRVGILLVKAFEAECKSRGAGLIFMVSMENLNPDRFDKFYKNNNFKKMETHYVKELI